MSAPEVASITKQLSQEQVNEYANAAGDHNPIHIDVAFAEASPFGGTIAHGMLVLASLSEMMARSLGKSWLISGRLRVRFKAPARTRDSITASAKAQSATDGGRHRYVVDVVNQDGEVLISGTAEVDARG